MMVRKTLTVLFLILVFNLGGFSPLTPARSSCFKLDMSQVVWNSLSFKSDNFFGTVTTKAMLEEVPVDEIEGRLIDSPQGVILKPSGTKVFIVTINSIIDPLIGATEYMNSQSWYDLSTGIVLQRIRLRQGKEKWQKTYRFTNKGVYRLRKKPNDSDETNLPLERWTNIEESFFPYDLSNAGCLGILEPSVLLYLVSAIDFTLKKTPMSLCVFNKKQLHQVQICKADAKRLVVDYMEKLKESEVRREGEIEAVKFSFKTRSLADKEKRAEPFSFLGLKGDFDIYIDKTWRIPVRVSGKITGLGEVDFKLVKVKLN